MSTKLWWDQLDLTWLVRLARAFDIYKIVLRVILTAWCPEVCSVFEFWNPVCMSINFHCTVQLVSFWEACLERRERLLTGRNWKVDSRDDVLYTIDRKVLSSWRGNFLLCTINTVTLCNFGRWLVIICTAQYCTVQLSVHDKLLDGCGQGEAIHIASLEALFSHRGPDWPPTPGGQRGRARGEAGDVLHGDLAVTPDTGHYGVHCLAPETSVSHPQVLTTGNEGQGAEVKVKHHQEGVRHLVARVA